MNEINDVLFIFKVMNVMERYKYFNYLSGGKLKQLFSPLFRYVAPCSCIFANRPIRSGFLHFGEWHLAYPDSATTVVYVCRYNIRRRISNLTLNSPHTLYIYFRIALV
jgi:hypothetical protein